MFMMNHHFGKLEPHQQDPLIRTCLQFESKVNRAISDTIETGDYKELVSQITEYDAFVYANTKSRDKTNLLYDKKNHLAPSWWEIVWTIPFERVRLTLEAQGFSGKLETLLDTKTVQSSGGDNYNKKNVDCGLGLWFNGSLLPMVIGEVKSGHFCSTAATNVDAIFAHFKRLNPKILTVSVVDNNVSIGEKRTIEGLFESADLTIMQRGKSRKADTFSPLSWERMDKLEKVCLDYIQRFDLEDFCHINLCLSNKLFCKSFEDAGFFLTHARVYS